jgi:DTW domain-containing protein YfiP
MPTHETQRHVLILQHPQEPDKELGSAKLAHAMLPNSTLKIGLSWRNLKAVLGREAQPSRWAVLYLGSGVKDSGGGKGARLAQGLHFVRKNATLLDASESERVRSELEGVILLDGTWSQAKTLWWRNAWLLKLRRAILVPSRPSLYKELRREPRRECLSTLESIAETLDALGEAPAVGEALRAEFAALLDCYRKKRITGGRP